MKRGERGQRHRDRVWHWYCNGNGDATSTATVADGREQQIMLHNGRAAGEAASCKLPVASCKLEAAAGSGQLKSSTRRRWTLPEIDRKQKQKTKAKQSESQLGRRSANNCRALEIEDEAEAAKK